MSGDEVYLQLARIGKALSNPLRLRILDRLELGEHTVDELAAATGIPVKNTSAQLQQLRGAQLVTARRDGVHMRYRVAGPETSAFLGALTDYATGSLADLRDALAAIDADAGPLDPVGVDTLPERIADGALLVDVRSAADHARGHIPGALSIPVAELGERLAELPPSTEVIAYCSGPYCVASADAVAVLAAAGRPARRIDGGLTAWVRSGRPIDESARPQASP